MLRRLRNYLAVVILALTPGVTLLTPVMVHAAADTCTWTAGGVDDNFLTTGNWSGCDNSNIPESGDALIFPVTAPSLLPINDMVGATFTSITFNGTSGGGQGYALTGTAFTLAGNITDTSDQDNTINNDITVSGISTITTTDPHFLSFTGAISGTGSIVKDGTGTVSVDFTTGSVTLTGSMTVNAGVLEVPFGTSQTFSDVNVGASTAEFRFRGSSTDPYTVTVPIALGGGTLSFSNGLTTTSRTVNITGAITLAANSTIYAATNIAVNIQGSLAGTGFVLGAAGLGTVTNNSSSNTSDTPDGLLSSSGGGFSPEEEAAAPAAPDTGFALVSANPAVTMGITIAAAGSILAIARLTRSASSRR